jgi:hypothetical protein
MPDGLAEGLWHCLIRGSGSSVRCFLWGFSGVGKGLVSPVRIKRVQAVLMWFVEVLGVGLFVGGVFL